MLPLAVLIVAMLGCGDDDSVSAAGHGGHADAGAGQGGADNLQGGAGGTEPGGGPPDPGALVAVDLESSVGVLLDDYPPELREQAAQRTLQEGDAFWQNKDSLIAEEGFATNRLCGEKRSE